MGNNQTDPNLELSESTFMDPLVQPSTGRKRTHDRHDSESWGFGSQTNAQTVKVFTVRELTLETHCQKLPTLRLTPQILS